IPIDIIRLGEASTRGGLIIHYLVGVAVEGIGQWNLYQASDRLDAAACHEAVQWLERLDSQSESLDEIFRRDQIYYENAPRWYGHFDIVLFNMAGIDAGREAARHAAARSAAAHRLLILELALHQYQLENGAIPTHLESLVPKYIAEVPLDPLDPEERPLRYVH